jgi:putative transposase
MKLHRQAHVVYKTQSHLVWVTRYRRKILVPGIAEYLKKALRAVWEFHPDWFLEEIGVERDHVHRHMVISPKYAVSRVVETLKSVTSRQLKEKFPHVLSKGYWDGGGVWARGFSPPRWASTRPRVGTMSNTKASRRRGKRSLNCKETPPGRAGFFILKRLVILDADLVAA